MANVNKRYSYLTPRSAFDAAKKMASKAHLLISLTCLMLMIGILSGVGVYIWQKHFKDEGGGRSAIVFGKNENIQLELTRSGVALSMKGDVADKLRGQLAIGMDTSDAVSCRHEGKGGDGGLCMEWNSGLKLEIVYRFIRLVRYDVDYECMTVTWTSTGDKQETPKDCYDMADFYWYGGFEQSYQFWPMNNLEMNSSPFITGDTYATDAYGGVIEGIFLSSAGVGIYVDELSPLYLGVNEKSSEMLCLRGKVGSDTPFFSIPKPFLKYDVCQSPNVLTMWQGMSELYFPKPRSVPSVDLFRSPIWCTWATYKSDINESTVLDFAEQISDHGFNISQLEIDDDWTPHYGDFNFSTSKFPDASALIAKLNGMGIPVTVWMHPFFNNDSDAFRELSGEGFLIKNLNSDDPHLVSWWKGSFAGVLDFTNPKAVSWYLDKTKYLKDKYNVASFKFDAGEVLWIPGTYRLSQSLATPNYITRQYSTLTFMADDQRRQELRVGFRSQESSLMVRMLDRDSNWSHRLGIKTLIPCALTFGFMGYPFVLPDMIGGNAYGGFPDAELFIRWLQATTFMPILQFSIVPWMYNDTYVDLARQLVKLHEDYADKIIELAENARKTGEPINRPLWWLDPYDDQALSTDTEFLLGSDVLVAPVLDQGAVSRDIYLPVGRWKDETTGKLYEGRQWLKDYPAPLNVLPYFTLVK
ncbi:myogenesis-regulating glycosidase-like isoform X2 [Physella acuta]|uniref:myogenesis-regulating glycosidase-like isoform X2 n=1 Tax=Physella acuta TaxID=109671 RepID=UPI0027DE6C98|nr:myogenesis-regulating glycosidase-like isoform X2 [Physella acuta]